MTTTSDSPREHTLEQPAPSQSPDPGDGTGNDTGNGARTATAPDPITAIATPTGPVEPQPLAAYLLHPRSGAVVTVSGRIAVVLARGREGLIDVHAPGHGVHALPPDTPATPVTDPAECHEALTTAVADLARWRNDDQNTLRAAEARHQRVLAEIRDYALERHLAEDICRDGLNHFLQTFSLGTYDPRLRITYTITGSYEIDTDDVDAAARDARNYIRPDLSELDDVLDDSDTYTVSITQLDQLDT